MGGVHIDGLVHLIREENEMDPTLALLEKVTVSFSREMSCSPE